MNSNASTPRHAKRVTGVTIRPYLTNSLNDIFISLSLRILIHIMPANAPIGVMFAPRLEPIVVASTAGKTLVCDAKLAIGTYATVIGMLFNKFAENADDMPYTKTVNVLDVPHIFLKKTPISLVIP